MGTDFIQVLRDKHCWALDHKAEGGLVVGCYTAMVPEELLWACNVLPVQLLASPDHEGVSQSYLPPYVCDCAKSILDQVMNGAYGYLDGLFLPHVCETIRGLAGICSMNRKEMFVRVLPAPIQDGRGARNYLRAEWTALAEKLLRRGALPLDHQRLEEAIHLYNANRQLIRRLYEIRGRYPASVAPEQMLAAVLAGSIMPKTVHNNLMAELIETLHIDQGDGGVRIILSGLLYENEAMEKSVLFSILRKHRGHVVWDDLAAGMRYRWKDIVLPRGGDPFEALIEGHVGLQPAPLRSPAESRAHQLLAAARDFGAQGVIFLIPKYCDPILFEIQALNQILNDHGCPLLCLEVSGNLSEGQIRTRVEAFIEMISDMP
jgi:benzoyl-CoA reductase subunit C